MVGMPLAEVPEVEATCGCSSPLVGSSVLKRRLPADGASVNPVEGVMALVLAVAATGRGLGRGAGVMTPAVGAMGRTGEGVGVGWYSI